MTRLATSHIYTLTHSPLTNTTYWPHTFSRVSPLPHILTPLTHPFPHTLTSLTHHTSPSDTTLPSHTHLPCTLSLPSPSLTPITRTPSPHTYTLLRSSKTRSPTSLPDTKHSSLMRTHPPSSSPGWGCHLNDLHHRSAHCVCWHGTALHRPADPERLGSGNTAAQVKE